jgi:hypothetical protein
MIQHPVLPCEIRRNREKNGHCNGRTYGHCYYRVSVIPVVFINGRVVDPVSILSDPNPILVMSLSKCLFISHLTRFIRLLN